MSRALLHAATLWRGDGALLLVGASGRGKTTLALALTAQGWVYGGDECVEVGGSGGLTSWATAARVKLPGGGLGWTLPAARRTAFEASPSRLWVAVLERSPAPEVEMTALEPGELCAALIVQTFDFVGHERERWPPLGALVAGARACRLRHGALDRAVAALSRWAA